jgi:hypothetical protein
MFLKPSGLQRMLTAKLLTLYKAALQAYTLSRCAVLNSANASIALQLLHITLQRRSSFLF